MVNRNRAKTDTKTDTEEGTQSDFVIPSGIIDVLDGLMDSDEDRAYALLLHLDQLGELAVLEIERERQLFGGQVVLDLLATTKEHPNLGVTHVSQLIDTGEASLQLQLF